MTASLAGQGGDAVKRRVSHKRLQRAMAAGAFLAAALLTLMGVELLREFGSSRQLRAEVDRSYETRSQIQSVFSLLQDAETGQRGYIITGEDRFLEPYRTAHQQLGAQMGRLRVLFDTDRSQAADFAALQALAQKKLAVMEVGVAARRTQGAAAADAVVANGQGKAVMDEVRVVVARMIGSEARSLDDYSRAAAARTRRTETLVAGMFLALIATVGVGWFLIWRFLKTRQAMLTDLRAVAARQQAIFDSAIDAIVTLNPSGSIETVNAAGERMFGYPAADLIRKDISTLIDMTPKGEGSFLQRLGASHGALDDGVVRPMEARRRDGRPVPVDVALGLMQLPTGSHIVAVIRDVSERRRVEQLKDEFVSTVSHELRTPLTSIAGSLGLLSGGAAGALPEKAARLIQIAQSNSQRLVRLINDILDVEKVEAGKLNLDIKPLDLRDVAQRSIDGVQGYAAELGVDIALADGLATPVRGDADRLIQVITNLLSNACKFSPRDGDVRIRVDAEGRMARLSVTDSGPGVPEAFRARIFSKFAQADSSDTRTKGGTGLGLVIAREIAERHGGRLWFESEPGQGATFHLDLPTAGSSASAQSSEGPRLLIVEDDADAAEILREMLERDGFAADIQATGREALAAAKSGAYAALLVDLHLPDADGITLIRALRSRPETRDLPVVVVSADTDAGKARGQSLQILDWMEKPFDQARLRAAVAALFKQTGSRKPVVLHVDDDQDILEVTASALAGLADIVPAQSLAAARAVLARQRPDIVILDLGLPDGSGLELLTDMSDDTGRTIPVVIYSAQEMDTALANRVEAILTKSRTSLSGLVHTVRRLTLPQESS